MYMYTCSIMCFVALNRVPLHNSLWIILLSQSNDPNPAVFKAVTMALFFLVEDDGKTCTHLHLHVHVHVHLHHF